MSEIFDSERLQAFVRKASYGKKLGPDKLFDISDEQESEDLAIGLLTEYVVEGGEAEFKKANIAAGYLTRMPDDEILRSQHNALRYQKPKIKRIASGVPSMTYDIASVAASSLRNKLDVEVSKTKQSNEDIQDTDFLHQSTGNLIRGLFENGIITPGHAAALLAYFRLEAPQRDSAQYQQLMDQVQRDLVTRIRSVEQNKAIQHWPRGIKIVESYIRRHENEAIALDMPNPEDTESVNGALVQLYTLRKDELLPPPPLRSQQDKYKDTVSPIDGFDD